MVTNASSVQSALLWAQSELDVLSREECRLDSQLLLCELLDKPRTWVIAHDDESLTPEQLGAYQQLITRRKQGEPVAYITGRQEFWSRPFAVNQDVLIPRPDTEIIVEEVLNVHKGSPSCIADLGTGSGAIAITLALEKPGDTLFGLDISPAAIRVAAQNRESLGATNLHLGVSRWLSAFEDHAFDVIVSNPPYIAADDQHMEALRYEPQGALVSGDDGLDDIRHLITQARHHLTGEGWLALEHGFEQQPAIEQLMLDAGYRNIRCKSDLSGNPRVVLGQQP